MTVKEISELISKIPYEQSVNVFRVNYELLVIEMHTLVGFEHRRTKLTQSSVSNKQADYADVAYTLYDNNADGIMLRNTTPIEQLYANQKIAADILNQFIREQIKELEEHIIK